ncbi:hypothetical protein EN873_30305 [bacterium M00.F.Ca.ET.230.01.1.1]|nr:hypothetical protein EN873_30305 [bacterium M00.F.Ca.ET.230.01.1.1]
MQAAADATQTFHIAQRRNSGRTLGILGCVFGVLGILTLGILFVPLALLFSTFGFVRGLFGRSVSGIGFSLLGVFLGVVGFIVSPALWAAVAAVGLTMISAPPATSHSSPAAAKTSSEAITPIHTPTQAAQAQTQQAEQMAKALSDLANLSRQLADFGPYADKNFSRFDRVEQKYRTITADMRRGLAKQKAIPEGPDADGARSDIAIWISDAQSAANDLHDSVESAHGDFTQQTKSMLTETVVYDRICVPLANAKVDNDPDVTTAFVWKSACTTFQRSEAAFYARVNSIEASFQHIAIVWGQESEAQKEIIQASQAVE